MEISKIKNNKFPYSIIFVAVVILIGTRLLVHSTTIEEEHIFNSNTIEDFVTCLNEKGVLMYGISNCRFCENQKRRFGKSFEKINHIKCDFDNAKCLEYDITLYPSWRINDIIYSGMKSLDDLASLSDCPAPTINK